MYKILLSKVKQDGYEIDLKDSWMLAAAEKICRSLSPAGKTVPWETYLLLTS